LEGFHAGVKRNDVEATTWRKSPQARRGSRLLLGKRESGMPKSGVQGRAANAVETRMAWPGGGKRG